MRYPEHDPLVTQIERLAQLLTEREPIASAALQLAAAQLRGQGERSQITQLLGAINLDDLLGVAALRLDSESAHGNSRVAAAAARVAEAAILYDASHDQENT